MARPARKVLTDEAPGLPARTPAMAEVRERQLPRERERALKRSLGFPPGRTPDEAIAPSCRCSNSGAGCGCPANKDPESTILRGKELGVPTQPLRLRVLQGDALGVPVKPWWERRVNGPARRDRWADWKDPTIDRGLPRPADPTGPRPHGHRTSPGVDVAHFHPGIPGLPTPLGKVDLRDPVVGDGDPFPGGPIPFQPPSGAPCDLWPDLAATPPVDDSQMPPVTRPTQLDFGDHMEMPGALVALRLGGWLWFVSNASFVYIMEVAPDPSGRPAQILSTTRRPLPRCIQGTAVPSLPAFTLIESPTEYLLVFPAGLRAEQGLLVGAWPRGTGPSQVFTWAHHPPGPSVGPDAFERTPTGRPDLGQTGGTGRVHIAASEEFIFVTRGAAGAAVFAAPSATAATGSPFEFLGHLRMPVWESTAWPPPTSPASPNAEHLWASHLSILELDDGREIVAFALGRVYGQSAYYPRAVLIDISVPADVTSALENSSLNVPAITTAGVQSQLDSILLGVVAVPPAPWVLDDGDLGVMTTTRSLDAALMPGSVVGSLTPNERRPMLLIGTQYFVRAVDVTALVYPSATAPSTSMGTTGDAPKLLVQPPSPMSLSESGSFGVSAGSCGPMGPNGEEIGPPANAFADSHHPDLRVLVGSSACLAGRYAFVGYSAIGGPRGNAMHLLAMDYLDNLSGFKLRKVGEARPQLDSAAGVEVRTNFVFDSGSNALFGSTRGRYGCVTFHLPPQSEASSAVAYVGGPVDQPTWYPDGTVTASCGGVLRPETSLYRRLSAPQTSPMVGFLPTGQSASDQLPFNLDGVAIAAGYLGPDALSQPWLDVGFGYEFLGAAVGTHPNGTEEALFLADRMGGALWACSTDPTTATALDVHGWLLDASDVVTTHHPAIPGGSVVIGAGTAAWGLHFLVFDYSSQSFQFLGRLLLQTGNFDDGSGERYHQRWVTATKLTTLGQSGQGTPTTYVAAAVGQYREGPDNGSCQDGADLLLFATDDIVAAMLPAVGQDHDDPSVAPNSFDPSWWNDGGDVPWLYRPWYLPAASGDVDPTSWTVRPGGPLPLSRVGLARSSGLVRRINGLKPAAWTWLPGSNIGPNQNGDWQAGQADIQDVAGFGNRVFAYVRMPNGGEANSPIHSTNWLVVFGSAVIDGVGGAVTEPTTDWCGAANGVEIIRRVGPDVVDPLGGPNVPAWQCVGPAGQRTLVPLAAIPLGNAGYGGEPSTIEIDPAGHYVALMSGKLAMWLIYVGDPALANYGGYPTVVAGLTGNGASLTEQAPTAATWEGWSPSNSDLLELLEPPSDGSSRGNHKYWPQWPLTGTVPFMSEAWTIPHPPFHACSLVRMGGELFLFLNTSPLTAWHVAALPLADPRLTPDTAAIDPNWNPLRFLGVLCANGRPVFNRMRAQAIGAESVFFTGEDGGITIPLCGQPSGASCCP